MLIAVGYMFVGAFDVDKLVYDLFAAVFVAIAHPQLGEKPKYEDLAALLKKESVGLD